MLLDIIAHHHHHGSPIAVLKECLCNLQTVKLMQKSCLNKARSRSLWCRKHNWLSFLANGCSASARSQCDPLIYLTLFEKRYRRWGGCWLICREACAVWVVHDETDCWPALFCIRVKEIVEYELLSVFYFVWNLYFCGRQREMFRRMFKLLF